MTSVDAPGAFVSISPDNGQSGRQGYIGLQSAATGLNVIGYDISGAGGFVGPLGARVVGIRPMAQRAL